jgi:hypothetical protein
MQLHADPPMPAYQLYSSASAFEFRLVLEIEANEGFGDKAHCGKCTNLRNTDVRFTSVGGSLLHIGIPASSFSEQPATILHL